MHQGKYRKCYRQQKWTDREYHVQDIRYVSHTSVKMSYVTTKFHALPFCGPHIKPHRLRGLSKNYHLQIYPKLGNEKCALKRITCVCVACINILDNLWSPGVDHNKQTS